MTTRRLLDAGFIWGKSVLDNRTGHQSGTRTPQMRREPVSALGQTAVWSLGVMNDLASGGAAGPGSEP